MPCTSRSAGAFAMLLEYHWMLSTGRPGHLTTCKFARVPSLPTRRKLISAAGGFL